MTVSPIPGVDDEILKARLEDLQKQADLNEKLLAQRLQEQEIAEFERIKNQQRKRSYSLAAALGGLFSATFGYYYGINDVDTLANFISRYYLVLLGLGAMLWAVASLVGSSNRVADVDFLRRASRRNEKSLDPQAAWPFPIGGDEEEPAKDFKRMIEEITSLLQIQAETNDEKASTLLDKGILYAGAGIAFFLISIISWQLVFHFVGFKQAHVYGIVSCASLFVAIELISAWFLKQYRNFIESSTELLKIKAIFDRLLLLKLASEESAVPGSLDAQLGTTVARDFVWPERPANLNKQSFDIKSLNQILSIFQKMNKNSKDDA
ncbi:hypothetical protein [Acidovorax sp. M2(2025)]|uniref:hypothetical protein n=1 Tax=Acidovorax sp. M2(2025) TaxID=3411355 RepID=UPI003BF51EDF